MESTSRDRHFNEYVELVAEEIVTQLQSTSRVVRAVKRLADRYPVSNLAGNHGAHWLPID